MSRILLVDDQREVLDGLQAFLSDSMENVEILRASNGAVGYELALQQRPDVIVVDVMMPQIDGLEMISLLKKEGVRSRIIILTAYERFDFARQAISLGVDDYLIKPVTQRQIYQAVMRQLSIGVHRRKYDLYSNVLLQEYLSGADIFLQKDAVLAMSGLSDLEYEGWMVGLYELRAAQPPEKLAQMLVGLEREFSGRNFEVNIYHTYGKSLFAVVNCKAEAAEECAHLLKRLSHERVVARGGSSVFGRGIDALCELYGQAERALERARKEKAHFCAYAEEEKPLGENELRRLTDALAAGKEDEAWQIVDEMLSSLPRSDDLLKRARAQFGSLIRDISVALCAYEDADSIRALEGAGSLLTVRREVRAWISRMASARPDQSRPPVINWAIEYIRTHCGEPLTVAYLANRANLSYPYFSTLFAQSTGMTVKRFILIERLRQAENMLIHDVLARVGDIARRCGFDDVRYFSTCFKKEYGETPQRYREIHHGMLKQ